MQAVFLRAKPHQPYTDCAKIRLTSTHLDQEDKVMSVSQSVITWSSFFY